MRNPVEPVRLKTKRPNKHNADEIATVEHGRVVERGTHEELLARGGTYARYYRMQFEGARAHELD